MIKEEALEIFAVQN